MQLVNQQIDPRSGHGKSMRTNSVNPQITVVIPTYNRAELLAATLENLAQQQTSPERFEVIVSDDGSTDTTFDVCREFSNHLPLRHRYQHDVGFRLAAARNGGAREASAPVIAFLDTGTLPGPDFVAQHIAAHENGPSTGHAVAGYAYAYRPWDPTPNLAEILSDCGTPAAAVTRHGDDPKFWDLRHEELARFEFDLRRSSTPWLYFWGMNFSVRAEDYWRVGGCAEMFCRWGFEDFELGFRLFRHGVPISFNRDAWVLEAPYDRETDKNLDSNQLNLAQFIDAYRNDTLAELAWAVFSQNGENIFNIERDYRNLLEWTEESRTLKVRHEIYSVPASRPGRLAVFGCGADLPADLPDAELFEFDRELTPDTDGGRHRLHRAIGLRTPLPAQSMDQVVITSRLNGLRARWGTQLLEEANRIGRTVIDAAA